MEGEAVGRRYGCGYGDGARARGDGARSGRAPRAPRAPLDPGFRKGFQAPFENGVQQVAMALPALVQVGGKGQDAGFFVAGHHDGARVQGGNGLRFHLRVAAGDQDHGVRVGCQGLADAAAGFLLGLAGYGAGVDDVEVGAVVEGDDARAGGGKAVGDGFGFELVELAAQGAEGDAQVGHWRRRPVRRWRPVVASRWLGSRARARS